MNPGPLDPPHVETTSFLADRVAAFVLLAAVVATATLFAWAGFWFYAMAGNDHTVSASGQNRWGLVWMAVAVAVAALAAYAGWNTLFGRRAGFLLNIPLAAITLAAALPVSLPSALPWIGHAIVTGAGASLAYSTARVVGVGPRPQ